MAEIDPNDQLGIDARICNPFNDLTQEQMEDSLHKFMEQTGIDRIYEDYFRRGMYIAQLPTSLDNPKHRTDGLSLTEVEKVYVVRERRLNSGREVPWSEDVQKWKLRGPLWRLVAICAVGAAVQGMDESAVNSAQLYYKYTYNISQDSTIVGLVNSAPYLCCILSCWLTHPLNKWFGRRWTIFLTCSCSAVFALAQAFAPSWEVMFVFRLLLGLGIGPKSATIPIYAAEAAPRSVRGGLVMLWQVFTAFGIMCGYLAGVAFHSLQDSLNWRLMIGSPTVMPLIVVLYIFTQPESMRWLIQRGHRLGGANRVEPRAQGHYQKAFNAFLKLRHTKLQAASDMFLVYHQIKHENEQVEIRNRDRNIPWYRKHAFELVTDRRCRRALIASLTCMFAQQMCGVNVIIYYSGTVLNGAPNPPAPHIKVSTLLWSMGFGLINFLFATPAFYTIDRWGRRSLLLLTFPFLAIAQLTTSIAFFVQNEHQPNNQPFTSHPAAIFGFYMFGVFYSFSEGPVPFVYAAESMPLYIRDIGMGLVTSVNWMFNWLIAITAPPFFESFSYAGAFLWYAVWCIILWFMIFLLVPETRLLSLEQLDAIFSQSSGEFLDFVKEEKNWFFKWLRSWVTRSRGPGKKPELRDRIDKRFRQRQMTTTEDSNRNGSVISDVESRPRHASIRSTDNPHEMQDLAAQSQVRRRA